MCLCVSVSSLPSIHKKKELERPPLPVEICVDSRYALGLADGRWLAPIKRNTDLAKRLRASVRALIRQRGHRNDADPRTGTRAHTGQ